MLQGPLFKRFGSQVGHGSNFPVLAKPFRASFEEIHTRKSTGENLRCWGWLAQDSAGHGRQDIFSPDSEGLSITHHVTVIWDPVKGTCQFLEHESGEIQKLDLARVMQGRSPGGSDAASVASQCPLPAPPPDPLVRREIPGERLIDGLLCRGCIYSSESGQTVIENWFSERLFHTVYEKTVEGDVEAVYRLFNVELEEPEASVFVLPSPAG